LTEYLYENKLTDDQIDSMDFEKVQTQTLQSALFDLIKYVQDNLSKKKKISLVFFDFTKAFDPIDRKILLRKLYECGIQGKEFKWFQSYLTNFFLLFIY